MNNLFNVPENTIRSCDELYSKFAKKVAEKKANSNKDLTIKDIFFVATSTNGIRLVEKSSLSGRWLALKATILGAFGMESALSKGKKSVENLITTKNLFFNDKELIIKVLRNSGKHDLEDITALGEKIINFVDLISQTSLSKNIKALPSSPQKIKIGETTASVLFADKIELRKRYSREFDSIFNEYKLDEREKIVSFLTQYSRTPELLEALKNRSTSPEAAANELRTALLRGAATATDKDFDTYYKALKLLETKKGFQGIVRDDPILRDLTLSDFAAVFADDSISGSGVEGGVTSKVFADYGVECLDKMTFLTPAAKNFREILANPINLRDNQKNPGDIKADIQERLNSLPEGSQRCLLLGGWSGHGIVYEIERQRDGKYAMRVYNQGEGAQYHDVVSEGYHERRAGCIGIVDISEKLIFKRSFLGNLQGLNSLKNGDEFLVNDILPMLAGKKEEIDPQIKHYLSPQRSGTCTYKSLQAFFAHSMSEVEYRHFKLQYKLHLLEKYLPTLKRNANVKIADMDDYQKTKLELGVMQRSLEHFSKGVDKLSGGMINSDIEQARNKILEYHVLLKKMQTQLIKFEKLDPNSSLSLATGSSPVVIIESYENTNLAQMYFGSASSIQPIPLSETMIRRMKKIEDLNPLDPTFSAQVEEIINSIADDPVDNYDGMHYGFLGMHQMLLKKIGSLKNIDQLRFSNPVKAVASLHYINTQASNQSAVPAGNGCINF